MMIGRERERQWRVEGGRVAEGNERGRDGPRHGRREEKRGMGKRAALRDWIEREGREQGSKRWRETGQVHNREPGRSRVTI